MRIHIDIRNDIPPTIALECVKQVIEGGRNPYCYVTTFDTNVGEVCVATREHRMSDCFVIYKNEK